MTTLSVIGQGTTIRGAVRGDGDLEIYGSVEGSVVIQGEVLIGETALIKSDVRARRVIVRGAVRGNVSADEVLILEPGARVLGDLGAPQVGIRPGGLVRGHVSTAGPLPLERPKPAPVAAAKAPAARAAAAPPRAAAPVARPAPPPRAAPAPRPQAAPPPVERVAPPPPPPPPSSPVAVAAPDDLESAEPPAPVVPALPKGARAAVRRKGAK